MADNTKREVRRPDGWSFSIPLRPFPVGIGGAYYSNPGSPAAPPVTLTGSLGFGTSGQGLHSVFLRKGMTSEDTLGYGASGNLSSIVPSVTVNASIPDENYIPQPWKAKVSSVEAGASTPGAAAALTYTWTPRQIADFLARHGLVGPGLLESLPAPGLFGPASSAMGPEDELSPFARTLRSGVGGIGAPSVAPVGHLSPSERAPLGNGMADWSAAGAGKRPASVAPAENGIYRNGTYVGEQQPLAFEQGASPVPFASNLQNTPRGLPGLLFEGSAMDPSGSIAAPAGGLPGLIQDYLRNKSTFYR